MIHLPFTLSLIQRIIKVLRGIGKNTFFTYTYDLSAEEKRYSTAVPWI